MSKNIVGLIAEKNSNEAVSAVKKALAKKLVQSISEAKGNVARKTYGRLVEFYGGDEQPDYMNDTDNAYALFFANALKKFGVSGPEDFRDDVTKQRFFDYVDHNWRAQDAVQTPIANATQQSNMERGTQTQLPSPAAPPQAPIAPSQGPTPTTAQGNDPSVATMSPAGPSVNQTSPLDQSGQDPTLNNVQNAQTFGGPADQYGNSGNPQGMSAHDACPYCKGSGKAACPTCGRPHGLDNQQGQMGMGMDGGMGSDLDQDPDLEIGPEEGGEQPLAGDDDSEVADGQFGDEEGMGGGDEMDQGDQGGEGAVPGAEDEDTDDPFDDEDAYTIDASDFQNAGGGDEMGDEDGMNGDEDEDEDGDEDDQFGGDDEDQGGDQFGNGDDEDQDVDDDDLGDDDQDSGDEFGSGDQFGNGDEDDQDPDLEIGDGSEDDSDDDDESDFGSDDDDDEDQDDNQDDDQDDDDQNKVPVVDEALKHQSWSRKERKTQGKRKQREDGKKAAKIAEDFGFGLDDAEDAVFIAEAMMQAGADPALNKIISYVQDQLNRIKKMRNTMLMQLRRQRAVLKKDPALGPEEKMEAMKQLATMAKDNRKFFKSQAKLVKAIFTGNLGGGDMSGDDMDQDPNAMDQGMDQDGMDQGDDQQPQGKKPFPPKKGGFPPKGDDDQDVDPDNDGDNDMDPDQDTDQDFAGAGDEDDSSDDDSGDDSDDSGSNFPPKKKGGFPPKKDKKPVEENEKFGQARMMPTFAELKKKKFGNAGMHQAHIPQAHPVKEDELTEYSNKAAIEGKIKMLHMQIASQGDPGGKRRAALKNLEAQLNK
jgi:hypothetical protein